MESESELSAAGGAESCIDSSAVVKDVADTIELARDSDRISGTDEGSLKDDGGGVDEVMGGMAGIVESCPTAWVAGGACAGFAGGSVMITGLNGSFTGDAKGSSEFVLTSRVVPLLSPGVSWRL